MVGPSLSDDRRQVLSSRLKLFFVAVVAVSGGSIALQSGAGPVFVVAGAVGGTVLGGVLVWYLGTVVGQARRRAGGRR
jgi:hypothetical protein